MLERARAFYGRLLRAVSRRVTAEPFAIATKRMDDFVAEATTRMDDFDAGATTRMDDFVAGASTRMDDFDAGATTRMDDFVAGATMRMDDFVAGAATRMDGFAAEATMRMDDFVAKTTASADGLVAKMTAGIGGLETRLMDHIAPPLWIYANYTEPRVSYAMHDLVRPGQVAFDVGSNFGGLTVVLSRLVGPRGIVCAFEGNPLIAAKCQQQLTRSGAVNAHVYHGAIYRSSGKMIDFYLSNNQVSDSIYRKTENKISVQTIALDDFVSRLQLVPDFVKMDIEGAESDALLGFERTIDAHYPTLILEHAPSENPFCLEFLLAKGYRAIDLQNYKEVKSGRDILEGTVVTDLLYAMPDRLIGTPYSGDLQAEKVVTLLTQDFQWAGSDHQWSKPLDLKPGRYLATLDLSADGEAEAMCGVWDDAADEAVMRVHAQSGSLPNFAHRIVFDFAGGPARMFVRFLQEPDPSFKFEQVEIWRIPAFEAFRAPLLTSR